MSYYEIKAEGLNYKSFVKRSVGYTKSHFHGAFEFLFVCGGTVEVCVADEKRILKRGDACFVDCFCKHSYLEIKDSDCYIFLGPRRIFERIEKVLGETIPPPFFRFDNYKLLDTLLVAYKNYGSDDKSSNLFFQSAAGLIASEIYLTTPFIKKESKGDFYLVASILKYAEENVSSDLSLQTLSSTFGYSREHLSRVLHSDLNENWSSYVARLRVGKVKKMIEEDPDIKVIDAAFSCGFESANTFYRAYKKTYGITPKRTN